MKKLTSMTRYELLCVCNLQRKTLRQLSNSNTSLRNIVRNYELRGKSLFRQISYMINHPYSSKSQGTVRRKN